MVESTSEDKFDARGVPCTFLGYPSTQKGIQTLQSVEPEGVCVKGCEIL